VLAHPPDKDAVMLFQRGIGGRRELLFFTFRKMVLLLARILTGIASDAESQVDQYCFGLQHGPAPLLNL
jgi:hypothetical protein